VMVWNIAKIIRSVLCRHGIMKAFAATGIRTKKDGMNGELGVVVTCETCRRTWAFDVVAGLPQFTPGWVDVYGDDVPQSTSEGNG